MTSKLYVAAVFVALIAVAATAPASDPGSQLEALFTFRGPDPWSIAIFNLMGVWPVLFGAVLLLDGPGQRVPAWPFVLLSFALGAFVLAPYILLRATDRELRPPGRMRAVMSHPWVPVLTGLTSAALVGYAATTGSWATYFGQLQGNGFVRTYSADFAACTLLFPAVAWDDRKRFGGHTRWWPTLIPLAGAVWHLAQRRRGARQGTGRGAAIASSE